MATSVEVPEDDEAWLYGDPEKKAVAAKAEAELAASGLSADAAPFKPSKAVSAPVDDGAAEEDDKEAGEVNSDEGEENNAENQNPEEDDDSDDDDDVQVTIGDIKTQTTTYEKFKSGYTRSGQAIKGATKGVDLDMPGTINDQSVYDYDLTSLDVDQRAWRKPGADITDYFNYGFTEDTWMKYCEKQKWLRNENGVGGMLFGHVARISGPRRDPPPSRSAERTERPDRSEPKPEVVSNPSPSPSGNYRLPSTTLATPTSLASSAAIAVTTPPVDGRLAGPPPGRKMSGTIDVIGSTRNDSRRPVDQYDYGGSDNSTDYSKKWQPQNHGPQNHGPPGDLPPPHLPPPGYGPPPPMVPPPGAIPPPHMGGPPMGVPPPGATPRFPPGGPPPHGYYPPPSGPPPPDRGPPPGYDNRGNYGSFDGGYGAPPPGYGAPPPSQPPWDNRGPSFNDWDFNRRSPPRSDSDFNRQGRPHMSRRDGRDRSPERGDDHRERRHRDRDRSERSSSADREKDERHRSRSRKEGSEGSDHRSKHKKSRRSKRDRDDEPMDTGGEADAASP